MACIRWLGAWLYQDRWTEKLAQCRVVGGQSCWVALIGEMGYRDLDLEQGFDYSVGVVIHI